MHELIGGVIGSSQAKSDWNKQVKQTEQNISTW